jgi:hypothetical protein
MALIDVTDRELWLLHTALHSFLDDFGHDQSDLLREIKQLLQKLPPPSEPPGPLPA